MVGAVGRARFWLTFLRATARRRATLARESVHRQALARSTLFCTGNDFLSRNSGFFSRRLFYPRSVVARAGAEPSQSPRTLPGAGCNTKKRHRARAAVKFHAALRLQAGYGTSKNPRSPKMLGRALPWILPV